MTAEILVFETLDSTNSEARRRAEAGARGPLWLMARRQTAGRGRRGRDWRAGQGNLTATLLTTADRPAAEVAQVAFVAALAVADLLDVYLDPARIALKWPNDVLLAGDKAAGVLIETGAAPAGDRWLAIGVGVNLADYPTDVERPATSLAAHLPSGVSPPAPEAALEGLAAALDARWAQWRGHGFAAIRAAWATRASGLGQPCVARLPHETVRGLAEGLDGDGALRLRLDDGQIRRITAGDIFFGAP